MLDYRICLFYEAYSIALCFDSHQLRRISRLVYLLVPFIRFKFKLLSMYKSFFFKFITLLITAIVGCLNP